MMKSVTKAMRRDQDLEQVKAQLLRSFRSTRSKSLKCCCGHRLDEHGGNPSNYHWRLMCSKAYYFPRGNMNVEPRSSEKTMRGWVRSCRCFKFKRCSPWHQHLRWEQGRKAELKPGAKTKEKLELRKRRAR